MMDEQIIEMLKKPTKSRDICKRLNINERMWRKIVRDYNNAYEQRENLIVSNKYGYRVTTDKADIKRYAFSLINNSVSQLRNAKRILKALGDKNQLKLQEEEINLYDLVQKMKV